MQFSIQKRTHWIRFVLLVPLALLALAMPASAADSAREFVPEVDVFINLSDDTRLFLLGDLTRNVTNHTTESELGVHVDITLLPRLRPKLREADWHRNRYLWTRAGYVQLDSSDDEGKGPTERRGILELTGRVPLPNEFWLVNRGRVELREMQGESSMRYRLRIGVERELVVGGVTLVPYAQAEAFRDSRFDAWNRKLYQVGAEIELSKAWRIEPYYARQNDSRSSPAHVDRLGLVLKYYH